MLVSATIGSRTFTFLSILLQVNIDRNLKMNSWKVSWYRCIDINTFVSQQQMWPWQELNCKDKSAIILAYLLLTIHRNVWNILSSVWTEKKILYFLLKICISLPTAYIWPTLCFEEEQPAGECQIWDWLAAKLLLCSAKTEQTKTIDYFFLNVSF